MKEVICSKASDERCPDSTCPHGEPHSPLSHPFPVPGGYKDIPCTDWEDCYDEDGLVIFEVKCVGTTSVQGKKILRALSKSRRF